MRAPQDISTCIGGEQLMATSNSFRRRFDRRGAAAAELALCLPLIVFLLLASLEACSMIFLDHSLTIASYEGVR
ncbi:MAG: TadE/TadG family type IV pilus assembly protein, partial [Pirellulales bacterium]